MSPGTNALLTASRDYAERGWPVFPVHTPDANGGCSCGTAECLEKQSQGKHPRTRHGFLDGSTDPAVIGEWWERWPDANIAIVTGARSRLIVLDIDPRHDGDKSLAKLEKKYGPLPVTWMVRSGGGGWHLYFLLPEGVHCPSREIAPGLDVKADGGMIIAPGSLHQSGQRYELAESAIPPVPCPDWLLKLAQEKPQAQPRQTPSDADGLIVHPHRTPHLVSLAGTMHKRGMDLAAIEAALLAENTARLSPPLPEEKVRKIAHDIPARYPNSKSEPEPTPHLRPDLVCLADVEPRRVDWLWEPYIPARMLSMISGDPSGGKTYVALAIAADLSRGKLCDGRIVDPANTLYLTCENPIAECIRPRFDLLGGDPARFFLLKGVLFDVDEEGWRGVTLTDIPILDAAIKDNHARLVVADPVQGYLGAGVDMHRSNETRPVLDGLARLAEKHNCAVLLVRHLSKQIGGKAIHRGLGSIDLTAAARSEMLAGSPPDDPDTRALIHIKSNVGRMGHALGYTIDHEGRFSWTGESSLTAADLLAAPAGPGDRKLAEASGWLTEQLKTGSRDQKQLRHTAEQAGIAYRTLRRAKDALGVHSYKVRLSGPWVWSLIEGGKREGVQPALTRKMDTFKEGQDGNVDTFEGVQKLCVEADGHLREGADTFASPAPPVDDATSPQSASSTAKKADPDQRDESEGTWV
jgi:Bifunctional DNA primase/polymerase, N-terminal/AAA domain